MKRRDLRKLIEKDGWKYSYSTGGHDRYTSEQARQGLRCLGMTPMKSHRNTHQCFKAGGPTMTRRYPVLYEWSGKNFSGYSPDIPSCIATGKTLDKIRKELISALESHLQWMKKDGENIPTASKPTVVDMQDDPEFPSPAGYYVVVEWLEVTLPKSRTKRSTVIKSASRELVAA